jgi:hypothetical protein
MKVAISCGWTYLVVCVAGCTPAPPPLPFLPQYVDLHESSGWFSVPQRVRFDRGASVLAGREGVAVAAGPDCVLLADLAGPDNRCELLLGREGRFVLYDRMGQRATASAAAQWIDAPTGVRVHAERDHVVVRFNLYVQRSERWALDPFTQRRARQLRLTGSLRLPRVAADASLAREVLGRGTLLTDRPEQLCQELSRDLPAFPRIPLPALPGGASPAAGSPGRATSRPAGDTN